MHSTCLCKDRVPQHARAKHAQLGVTHLSGEGCWIQHLRECVFEGAWHLQPMWLVQVLCHLQLPWSRHALQLKMPYTAWSPAWRPQGTPIWEHYSRRNLMT